MNRELKLVELVDETGRPIGSSTVDQAHTAPGQLHRAFSVLLVGPDGRLLLQQRAAVKSRFPLRWANACCGHPAPAGDVPLAEHVPLAAARRLAEELGVTGIPLTEIGVYAYRADDPATGRVEYEYDHVLLGRTLSSVELRPDPDEVADLRWVPTADILSAIEAGPDAYAPWLAGVVRELIRELERAR